MFRYQSAIEELENSIRDTRAHIEYAKRVGWQKWVIEQDEELVEYYKKKLEEVKSRPLPR